MRLDWQHGPEVAAWVATRIPQMAGAAFGPCQAVGVVDQHGRPLGGVVFHGYVPRYRTIEVSFASESPRWLTKRILTGIMAYPFGQLQVRRLTSLTPKKNKPARAFIDAFGFVREGVVWRGFGDDDAIISRFTERDWRQSRFNLNRSEQANPDRVSGAHTLPA